MMEFSSEKSRIEAVKSSVEPPRPVLVQSDISIGLGGKSKEEKHRRIIGMTHITEIQPSQKTPLGSVLQRRHFEVDDMSYHNPRFEENTQSMLDLQPARHPANAESFTSDKIEERILCHWFTSYVCPKQLNLGNAEKKKARRMLWHQYEEDAELHAMLQNIETKMKSGRLIIGSEENLVSDIKSRSRVVDSLLSYHAAWLLPAAEISIGRPIPQGTNLNSFLNRHLMACPSLLAKYRGIRTTQYWKELVILIFMRLLLIIGILDRVGTSGLPDDCPPLFRRDNALERSTSASILESVFGAFLRIKDVKRHLSLHGFQVFYASNPIDHMDFIPRNLAVDMRDGLKLCRLAEKISGKNGGLVGKAIFPAIKRLDRLHNVSNALEAIKSSGVNIGNQEFSESHTLFASSIVDGDRQATLNLLWRIVLQHYIPNLIKKSQVQLEVEYLKHMHDSMQSSNDINQHVSCLSQFWQAQSGSLIHTGKTCRERIFGDSCRQLISDIGPAASHYSYLFIWIENVTRIYDPLFEFQDLAQSLSDGVAFCIVAHHYLGNGIVPLKDIQRSGLASDVAYQNFCLLERSLENAKILSQYVSICRTLQDDLRNDKLMNQRALLFVSSSLCESLLSFNQEHRAARIIQSNWKQFQSQKLEIVTEKPRPLGHLQQWIQSSIVIQQGVRSWLLKRQLARWAKEQRLRVQSATVIQSHWRAYYSHSWYHSAKCATIRIQCSWHMYCMRSSFLLMKLSATTIKSAWRTNQLHRQYEKLKLSTLTIQSEWKKYKAQKRYKCLKAASITIQSYWRGYKGFSFFKNALLARKVAENALLRHQEIVSSRKKLKQTRLENSAALVIQRNLRSWFARSQLLLLREMNRQRKEAAANTTKVYMQKLAEAMQLFAKHTMAARTIQVSWHEYRKRMLINALQNKVKEICATSKCKRAAAAKLIASYVPVIVARRAFLESRVAAIKIQRRWRHRHAIRTSAATIIQRNIRKMIFNKLLCVHKEAAILIQSAWRGFYVRHTSLNAGILVQIRARLDEAAQMGLKNPSCTIQSKMKEILRKLETTTRSPNQDIIRELKYYLENLISCRRMLMDNRIALGNMFSMCKVLVRDRHQDTIIHEIIDCLIILSRCTGEMGAIFDSILENGGLQAFAEILSQSREKESIFYSCISFFEELATDKNRAENIAQMPKFVSCVQGTFRLLIHKRNSAMKYLNRLENAKGSDISAKQATRSLIAVEAQIRSLNRMVEKLDYETEIDRNVEISNEAIIDRGKNTLVREALREITNNQCK